MVIESKYLYDRMSRLRSAVYGERSDLSNKVNRFNESVDEYSRNGSIKHLVRRGKKNDGEYGKIDNLHAYYDGRFKLILSGNVK
ncbi:MAG: hypothetical protein K6A98_08315 [Prevotella sp.]|nr:hypothetical protein [Prevotella sp.]